jgi:hypothetical protein
MTTAEGPDAVPDVAPTTSPPALAREALEVAGIASAAIFAAEPGPGEMILVGVAGIEGAALGGLIAAVRDPRHPVRRAVTDPAATFNVAPMNPGGPALRSHLPLRQPGAEATSPAVGVLALAHGQPVVGEARETLERLATAAATVIATAQQKESR